MTNSNEQSEVYLKMAKDKCCDNCTCQRESNEIKEIDAMGREKFWEETGKP